MFLEKIKTPGLSHLSYLIGSQGKAAVIDPRRDCEIYLEKARANGLKITHIFESHRNEDLVSGAPILAEWTGASVLHGPNTAENVVYAAHGAGSVCGSGMAEREFSTLGHERKNNPRLQFENRDAFIDYKVRENHYQPPYFRLIERLNSEGGEQPPRISIPRNLSLTQLLECDATHVVDIREPLAYASGHLPGSMCLPIGMISAFAGWFIGEGESLVLIASEYPDLEQANKHLVRIALDNIIGGYVGIVPAAAQGTIMEATPMIGTQEVAARLAQGSQEWTLLDVRDADERAEDAIEGSEHIYVGELNTRWKELDKSRHYTLMCASGMRATVAAGWLASRGFGKVDIYLGSMGAWKSAQEREDKT